jgi:hypothetical protein
MIFQEICNRIFSTQAEVSLRSIWSCQKCSPILVPTDDIPKPHWHFWFAIENNFNQSTRVHHLSVKCGNLMANEEEKLKFSVLEKRRMLTIDNWIEGKPHKDGFCHMLWQPRFSSGVVSVRNDIFSCKTVTHSLSQHNSNTAAPCKKKSMFLRISSLYITKYWFKIHLQVIKTLISERKTATTVSWSVA